MIKKRLENQSDASSLFKNRLTQNLIAHNISEHDSNVIVSDAFHNIDVFSMIRSIPPLSEINENTTNVNYF